MVKKSKFLVITIVVLVVAFVVWYGGGLLWERLRALHGGHG